MRVHNGRTPREIYDDTPLNVRGFNGYGAEKWPVTAALLLTLVDFCFLVIPRMFLVLAPL